MKLRKDKHSYKMRWLMPETKHLLMCIMQRLSSSRKTHLKNSLLHGLRKQVQEAKHQLHVDSLQEEIDAAVREQDALKNTLAQSRLDAKSEAEQAHANGARKAHLKSTLLSGLKSTVQQNRHKAHVDQLTAEIESARIGQEELERTLAQAKLDAVSEAEQARANGAKKAHLKASLLSGLKLTVRDKKHRRALQMQRDEAAAAAKEAAETALKEQEQVARKVHLRATLLNGLKRQAQEAKHTAERTDLEAQIAVAEAQKQDVENALLEAQRETRSLQAEAEQKLQEAKAETIAKSKIAHEKGARKAHLRATLLAGLKKQAASAKHNSERVALQAQIAEAERQKREVDQALQSAKDSAAAAAAEAAAAARTARKNRMRNALRSHLQSEKEKEKERLKAQALKEAAVEAQNRAKAANEALQKAKLDAEQQAEDAADSFARQLRQAHLKRKAFSWTDFAGTAE